MAQVIDYFERQQRTWHGEFWVQDELREASGSIPAARMAVWHGLLRARRLGAIFGDDIEGMFKAARDGA